MDNRSIDLFDIEHPIERHRTTHVHAYIRAEGGYYVLHTCPYTPETTESLSGIRRYPLMAGEARRIEPCTRFNAKRLAHLANDPVVLQAAHRLVGME